MTHWLFILAALTLTLLVLGLFIHALRYKGDDKQRQWRRIQENLDSLRYEYQRLQDDLSENRITNDVFVQRERELLMRTAERTSLPSRSHVRDTQRALIASIAVTIIMLPMTATGLYLYYGDYSSLTPEAQEQMALAKQAQQSQKNLVRTIERLEKGVVSDPNNLAAWEILAEHYYNNGDIRKAITAYQAVVRLSPKNAMAYSQLADLLVAQQGGVLTPQVGRYARKALRIEPYLDTALLLAGAVAMEEKNYHDAVLYWNRFRSMVEEGNEVWDAMTENINKAMKAGGMTRLPVDTVKPKNMMDGPMPALLQ